MKVAYIVSLFPKISETFILREMEALGQRGVEVIVISLKNRREKLTHPEAEALLGVTFYAGSPVRAAAAFLRRLVRQPIAVVSLAARVIVAHIRRPVLLAKSLPALATAAQVADLLAARGIEHVHAHWATYPALVAWSVKRLDGVPYSITAHAHDIFLPNPLLAEKVLASEFTVTISRFNARLIEKLCGEAAAAKVRVIHCGVEPERYPFRPAPAAGPARLVSVGRLVDYKGFGTLLRAVARLRSEGRELGCDIVGEGPLKGALESEIARLGLAGAARLLGPRTQGEVRDLLAGAAACVLGSERGHDGQMDGIPVVLMEAMALGVPAVATRISGIPEIVEDGRTGLLAEPGDADSLAVCVARVLDDPDLARGMAEAARRKVEEEFDLGKSADALFDLLRRPHGATS